MIYDHPLTKRDMHSDLKDIASHLDAAAAIATDLARDAEADLPAQHPMLQSLTLAIGLARECVPGKVTVRRR